MSETFKVIEYYVKGCPLWRYCNMFVSGSYQEGLKKIGGCTFLCGINKFTFFGDAKAFVHDDLLLQSPTVIIDNEAERRFEEILKEYPKYGKNYKTLQRYLGYHQEMQSLIKKAVA